MESINTFQKPQKDDFCLVINGPYRGKTITIVGRISESGKNNIWVYPDLFRKPLFLYFLHACGDVAEKDQTTLEQLINYARENKKEIDQLKGYISSKKNTGRIIFATINGSKNKAFFYQSWIEKLENQNKD